MGTGSFPAVKSGRGVTLTPHPLLVPWLCTGRTACTEPQGLYKVTLYLLPILGTLHSISFQRRDEPFLLQRYPEDGNCMIVWK